MLRAVLIGIGVACLSFPGGLGCRAQPAGARADAQTTAARQATACPSARYAARPAFDADAAFGLLKKQCDFGPRPLGTPAHEKLRAFLVATMKRFADKTVEQSFSYRGMPVANVVGVFYPAGSDKPDAHPVLLMAHWDTRPIADGPFSSELNVSPPFQYGPHGWNRTAPILGADDGASGVAILLELAREFKLQKPKVGVVILLDDGEDYGDFQANGDQGDGVEMGAIYFAQHYRQNPDFGRPMYGILLDMVGATNMILPRETMSQQAAPGTNDKVFATGAALGYGSVFLPDEYQSVDDDHLPIIKAGIPMIDLIHPLPYTDYVRSGYVYWHTLQDTVDKCSAHSLKVVGDTVAAVIYNEPASP